MSRISPRDCAHCGRMSASEPDFKRRPTCHHVIEEPRRLFAVRCWYCGARGPLSGSVVEAIARWRYLAMTNGAPKW